MEKRVVFFKGRGAVVSDWQQLMEKVPGALSSPIEMAIDLEIVAYEFTAEIHGLGPVEWAAFWLKKGDKRARNLGTYIPCPVITRESKISSKQARKEFAVEGAIREKSLRKKIRMVRGAFDHSLF